MVPPELFCCPDCGTITRIGQLNGTHKEGKEDRCIDVDDEGFKVR